MSTYENSKQYHDYLTEHIDNVARGFDWISQYLPELIIPEISNIITSIITKHDSSKYSIDEFDAYANYFYGEKSKETDQAFNYAWLHHIHNNPHHWQYWILQNDEDGREVLEMPYEYIIEMICDWWAFSWKKGNLFEIFKWYEKNKKKIVLAPGTRKIVEEILKLINRELDELEYELNLPSKLTDGDITK